MARSNRFADVAEIQRLQDEADWQRWGPYLSERVWGTLRESFAGGEEAWTGFPFEHSHQRAYRWSEDGLAGFSDRDQRLCMAVALWNEQDAILKERLFGLGSDSGNHGEDVKEYYFYLDGLPTHAYMKCVYKYPQVAYPYAELTRRNKARGLKTPEFELIDALEDAFEQGRYFDVVIEFAKASPEDILCRVTAWNRGPDPAPLHILPHLWYRNTWSWANGTRRPTLQQDGKGRVCADDEALGTRYWSVSAGGLDAALLFTNNETNREQIFDQPNTSPYVKDAFHRAIVEGQASAVNPDGRGTKCAAHVQATVAPGEALIVRTRLAQDDGKPAFDEFEALMTERIAEADAYYVAVQRPDLDNDERRIQRQAFAGLMWSKQYYHYDVETWLKGDPQVSDDERKPPEVNREWHVLRAHDIVSVPDKWEYPWFAAWDLAFQATTIAMVDVHFAKQQLMLLLKDRYLHRDGQIPSFEGGLSKVNPPVHAWAILRTYQTELQRTGQADRDFLERAFHKLLLNYESWFDQKHRSKGPLFKGGFLGMDNIAPFERDQDPPTGGFLEQADSVGWVAFMSLKMLEIAVVLAQDNPVYDAMAARFLDSFVEISQALYDEVGDGVAVWNEEDRFFYDLLYRPDGSVEPITTRSYVGLIPMLAAAVINHAELDCCAELKARIAWYHEQRPDLIENLTFDVCAVPGRKRVSFGAVNQDRLVLLLQALLDEDEFLSPYGIRSLSRVHDRKPYKLTVGDKTYAVKYEPGLAESELMGGNSNWRGPIWAPINELIIESLYIYHAAYGGDLTVQMPAGSGDPLTLDRVAFGICRRVVSLFKRNDEGRRPALGHNRLFQTDPLWNDYLLFYEHFHGEDGTGLGANHQNGWTALVAKLIEDGGRV